MQPFPGNQIPASRLDPLAVNLLNNYVPLQTPGQAQLQQLVSIPQSRRQYTAKGDHRFSGADNTWIRYFRNLDGSPVSIAGGANVYALASPRNNLEQSAAASEIHSFSPSLLNEFHGSYTRVDNFGPASSANKSPRDLAGCGKTPKTGYVSNVLDV